MLRSQGEGRDLLKEIASSIFILDQGFILPRKKFNREAADKVWTKYTENLISTISESEKEGLEKGYSSYEIELLWQKKTKEQSAQKNKKAVDNETSSHSE